MMQSEQEYSKLLDKYLSGTISDEEMELLFLHKDDFMLKDLIWDKASLGDKGFVKTEISKRIQQSIRKKQSRTLLKYISAAALVVLIITAYFLLVQDTKNRISPSAKMAAADTGKKDFNPAINVATFTINGSQNIIDASSVSGYDLIFEGRVIGKKYPDQLTLYTLADSFDYKISTPKAGKFKVILPDQTIVWLSSASSVSFNPLQFKSQRGVKVTGETYFEVARNKLSPFVVKAKSSQITVLGTHFNVKAELENDLVKTTLFEGSVAIKNGKTTKILKPGQEALTKQKPLDIKNDVVISNVDLEKKAGWKNGYFIFDKADIREVMEELSKWYNVEIEYKKNTGQDLFKGKIRNDLKLSEVLNILELNGVQSEIVGNRVVVY